MKEIINDNQTKFIIGQNASENEYITLKYRRESEPGLTLWFHVDGFSGAHVIVIGEDISEDDIKEAACYAISHSKAPDGTYVSYCPIKNVKKKRGDPIGMFEINNFKRIKGHRK
jgi:predicted ribosome quality control (RQC) complex YloA/Tae2 family protein